jgi:hypothetical protein
VELLGRVGWGRGGGGQQRRFPVMWLNPVHVPLESSAAASKRDGGERDRARPRAAAEEVVVVGSKRMSIVDAAPRSHEAAERLDVRTVLVPVFRTSARVQPQWHGHQVRAPPITTQSSRPGFIAACLPSCESAFVSDEPPGIMFVTGRLRVRRAAAHQGAAGALGAAQRGAAVSAHVRRCVKRVKRGRGRVSEMPNF